MAESIASGGRTWFSAMCFLGILVLFCMLLSPETMNPFLYHFPWLGEMLTWLRNLVN